MNKEPISASAYAVWVFFKSKVKYQWKEMCFLYYMACNTTGESFIRSAVSGEKLRDDCSIVTLSKQITGK